MTTKEPYRFEFIRRLCPHLSKKELEQADARFAAYLDVVANIFERRAKADSTEPRAAPHTSEAHPTNS